MAKPGGLRGRLQYCYQDPSASLDPHSKIGRALEEPLVIHIRMASAKQMEREDTKPTKREFDGASREAPSCPYSR
jgi:ABC-type microcin C transport system duplicated ATPase subunit YejF